MNSFFHFMILAFLFVFFSTSCNTNTPQSSNSKTSSKEITYKGLLALGNTNQFIFCAGDSIFNVKTSSPQIREQYLTATRSSFDGQYMQATVTGQKMDNTLTIHKIIDLKPKNRFSNCAKFNVWALGNEPFWDLQISKLENRAVLTLMDEEPQVFQYVEPKDVQKNIVYYFQKEKHRLQVTLNKKPSVDASGNQYTYEASIKFKGKEYKGVATVK